MWSARLGQQVRGILLTLTTLIALWMVLVLMVVLMVVVPVPLRVRLWGALLQLISPLHALSIPETVELTVPV